MFTVRIRLQCTNNFEDMHFFSFTMNLIIVLVTIISVVELWCHAFKEVSYSFHYTINSSDLISQHWEHRSAEGVRGSYSFLQPDGLIRVVDYHADSKSGFRAFVRYRKITDHPLMGHLRFPNYYKYPIILSKPVSFITRDLFKSSSKYPNLPE